MSKLAERIKRRLSEDGKRCRIDSRGGKLRITIEPTLPVARHLRACGVLHPVEDFVIVISPRRIEQMIGRWAVAIARGGDICTIDPRDTGAIAAAVALAVVGRPLHESN
jgi:hypothetical protein